jgi:hypothetical protein
MPFQKILAEMEACGLRWKNHGINRRQRKQRSELHPVATLAENEFGFTAQIVGRRGYYEVHGGHRYMTRNRFTSPYSAKEAASKSILDELDRRARATDRALGG